MKDASHNHHARRPPLHFICDPWPEETSLLCLAVGISLAIHSPIHLEIVVAQRSPAICAGQTTRMVFLLSFRFEILAFNAPVARVTAAVVQLMVMALTIWGIIENVECRGSEWLDTGRADKTIFMVTARETPVGR